MNPWKYMKKHNMYQEKMELYRDFVCDLVNEIHKTFLGEVMGEKEYKEHFDWCWNKILNKFRDDNIHFHEDCEVKDDIWRSFYELFYTSSIEDIDELRDNLMITWNFIFDHSKMNKSKTEIDYTVKLYHKFDKCLNTNYD